MVEFANGSFDYEQGIAIHNAMERLEEELGQRGIAIGEKVEGWNDFVSGFREALVQSEMLARAEGIHELEGELVRVMEQDMYFSYITGGPAVRPLAVGHCWPRRKKFHVGPKGKRRKFSKRDIIFIDGDIVVVSQ